MECETAPGPFDVDMDLAFVLDSSQNINTGQLKTATDFIGKIIDQLPISPAPQTARRGARIALVQHSPLRYAPQRGQAAVKLEFDFLTYRNGNLMKRHLQTKVNHLQGASAIGHAIEWTVTNIFNKVQNPKTLKVIFAVVSGKTSSWDKKKLREMSLQYRCLGYSIFTLAIGKDFSNSELYELSSTPREQHFIHLGAVLEPEMQFAERFVQTFFNLLKSGMNKYPPPDLQEECRRRPVISLNEESGQTEIEEYFEEITAPPNEEGEIEYEADQASIPSIPYEYNNEEAMIPPETNAGYKQDYSDYINGTGWDLMDTVSRTAKDICQMDLDEGPCQEYSLMWYYDRYQIQCKRFWYGGCGGNENRFETKTSCEEFCTSSF
ncbi:collagen alpha-6(VI) chain-like [Protopterus annectens]|uniref:collagen alpha-6(VI) chain-like n=1 Tax=Protopterus annectens TaxID=7888 RepID=UPI001CFB54B2|nr:collagen alpha-6(VI) chain-like [Protopterus annectens]